MSVVFGTAGGQFLTGGANVSLPNSDWCVAAFLQINDHTGTERNTVLSAGSTVDTNELTFGSLRLQDPGSTPGSALMRLGDGTNALIQLRSTTLDAPVGQWFLLLGQRSGTAKQLYTAQLGGAATLVASSTAELGGMTFGTPMLIGRRRCRQVANDDCKALTLGWVAWGSFSLSASQIAALASGLPPTTIPTWTVYLPFMTLQSAYTPPIGGGTYTVTGFPTEGTQPVRLW
jgi:hypothetical protein